MLGETVSRQRRNKFNDTILAKGFGAGVLSLLLLIPVAFVSGLVREREERRREAEVEAASGWGRDQRVLGPVLAIPYKRTYPIYDTDGRKVRDGFNRYVAYFLPEELSIEAAIDPQTRYRGIYEFVLYSANLQMNGRFVRPDFERFKILPQNILWDEATVIMAVNDPKGIAGKLGIDWNGRELAMEPGLPDKYLSSRTVSVPVRAASDIKDYSFSLNLALHGSSSFMVEPVGRLTNVSLTSPWTNPSFTGSFLPESRQVSDKGFSAKWQVVDLNRDYPQQWTSEDVKELSLNTPFGLEFKLPVDHYQKTHRTLRYALLFVGLTFLVFFLVEVMREVRVHPIQYVLVGLALVIFYSLLLSLSEHLTFTSAYLSAAAGITLLISGYTHAIARNGRITTLMGGVLVLLYGFLFLNLQLQDYALLVGNIFLLLVLASVMYVTRNVDWYREVRTPLEPSVATGTSA